MNDKTIPFVSMFSQAFNLPRKSAPQSPLVLHANRVLIPFIQTTSHPVTTSAILAQQALLPFSSKLLCLVFYSPSPLRPLNVVVVMSPLG
jgi:hypothetical protein